MPPSQPRTGPYPLVAALVDLQRRGRRLVATASEREGGRRLAEDALFDAEMNAELVKDAEEYYRAQFGHMRAAVLRLDEFLSKRTAAAGHAPRIVLWAHNSHLGDARYTESRIRGKLNVGQLMREAYGEEDVCVIGFTTYTGTVMAAPEWGEPGRVYKARDPGGSPDFLMDFRGVPELARELDWGAAGGPSSPSSSSSASSSRHRGGGYPRAHSEGEEPRNPIEKLERFIGVIYRPTTERWSHMSSARLARQARPAPPAPALPLGLPRAPLGPGRPPLGYPRPPAPRPRPTPGPARPPLFDLCVHIDETGALRPLDPL
eukprot:tig00000057_g126.t1